jgi:membrane-bound metal-dependent hydrolase YbcI (DUF457 family)
MDPLTHSLIGGLAGQTAGVSRRRFWIMFALGSMMDLDILANSLGNWSVLFQHRGISHSIFGVLVQMFFFAWVLKRIDPGPYRERAWHYSLPLGLHLLCDYLTSFGIPLFSPFYLQNFSLGIIGCVNILPMAIAGATLGTMYLRNQTGWKVAGVAWATWGIYLSFVSVGKIYATSIAAECAPMTPVPSLMNPFRWQAIGEDTQSHIYRQYSIDLLRRQTTRLQDIPMPNGDFPVKASMASSSVRKYIKENPWPVVRMQKTRDGWEVEWGRIMFSTRGLVRGNILIELDESGKITGEKKVVSFWDPETNS